MLKILNDLSNGIINEREAQHILMDLFSIHFKYSEDNIRTALEYGMNIGENSQEYTDKQFMEVLDICENDNIEI